MKTRYVFIVGLPRSGTKLVKNILERSNDVKCRISPETFFLGHLIRPGVMYKIRKKYNMLDDSDVRKFVNFIYSEGFSGTYWKMLKDGRLGVDKETLLKGILNSGRSERDIYDVLLKIHVDLTEYSILGDKTPGHLYHVTELLEWFPEAKVIHTFRDPRAILASEWRKRLERRPVFFASRLIDSFYTFIIVVHITLTWLYAIKLNRYYKHQYPRNYYLSKFECLINEPEKSVQKLCEFLEIPFEPEMLNPTRVDSSFSSDGYIGFDKETLTRWKKHLKPWMEAWLLFWGKKYLKEFGYVR